MTDNPCVHHSGLVSDIEALCKKIEFVERVVEKQFIMHEKAVQTAKNELDNRLQGMNEFRSQLTRQSQEFISRKEVELLIEKIEVKIESLQTTVSERKGSAQWSSYIITVLISMGVFLMAHLLFKF